MDTALNDWFVSNVLPHERVLMRYLSRSWRDRAEVDDLLQEVYMRAYEAAAHSPPQSVRSFLLTTARNIMTDRIRRSRIISIEPVGDFESLDVYPDEVTPERRLNARQELMVLAGIFSQLSPRCREVLWLRRVDKLTQKEVARHLGIGERSVETYLVRACEAMADGMFRGGALRSLKGPGREGQSESEHEQQ